MKRKTTIQLAVFVPALLVLAVGAWIGVNTLVAQQLDLSAAIEHGDCESVRYIVRWNSGRVNVPSSSGGPEAYWHWELRVGGEARLPLELASAAGNLALVEILVEAGANVSAQGKNGLTPLHWAAHFGHMDVVQGLVSAGADVNQKGANDLTPLHWAAHAGRAGTASKLLELGADVNAEDHFGLTPLDATEDRGRNGATPTLLFFRF